MKSKIKQSVLWFLYLMCVRIIATSQILRGFSATPDPSVAVFQQLLSNPADDFALGFVRIQQTWLALGIVHVSDVRAEPIWCANRNRWARWDGDSTELSFNGSLVLSDRKLGIIWSIPTNGNRVVLLDSGNLQVLDGDSVFLWQSFDHPTDTLVQNQNFTVTVALVSSVSTTDPSDGSYSMTLNSNNLALYADFHGTSKQIYWKRKAMEAKAEIKEGKGPIYARVSSNGFLGLYQTESSLVDVLAFHSFQRMVGFRRMRLEPDGNLRSYFWNNSSWVLDFEAIENRCELPRFCGSYGLCKGGGECSCLGNGTLDFPDGCFRAETGDFCGEKKENFWVLRSSGVELPCKELIEYTTVNSLKDCEEMCDRNCSCWGAVFGNSSGACYLVDYPVQTLLRVADQQKFGFFKARTAKKRNVSSVRIGLLVVGAFLVLIACIGFGIYVLWYRKKKGFDGLLRDG